MFDYSKNSAEGLGLDQDAIMLQAEASNYVSVRLRECSLMTCNVMQCLLLSDIPQLSVHLTSSPIYWQINILSRQIFARVKN